MKILSVIRYFVILSSLIIFCYQLNVALQHLMGDSTVDSTELISISKLDSLPVITFCPNQGGKLDKWGYKSIIQLTKGIKSKKDSI